MTGLNFEQAVVTTLWRCCAREGFDHRPGSGSGHGGRQFQPSMTRGIGWDEMASHTRKCVSTMARAVIDAPDSREEWNVQTDGRPHLKPMEGPPSDVMRERLAAINSKSEYHRTFVSRLVTLGRNSERINSGHTERRPGSREYAYSELSDADKYENRSPPMVPAFGRCIAWRPGFTRMVQMPGNV